MLRLPDNRSDHLHEARFVDHSHSERLRFFQLASGSLSGQNVIGFLGNGSRNLAAQRQDHVFGLVSRKRRKRSSEYERFSGDLGIDLHFLLFPVNPLGNEFVHHGVVVRFVEKRANRLRENLAHIMHLHEVFDRGAAQSVERSEKERQIAGACFAHVTNAKRKHKARKRRFLALFDCFDEIGGALLPHAFEFRQLLHRQSINIGRRLEELFFNEHVDHLFAQPIDTHGTALRKVHQRELSLRGTNQSARAPRILLLLVTHHGRAADWADGRHDEGRCVFRALVDHHTHNFRNHIAGAAHHNRIPDQKPQFLDVVLIV